MIRTLRHIACSAAVVVALAAFSGCGGAQSPADKTPAAQSGHYEGDGHDHGAEETAHFVGDGHVHGNEVAGEHPTEGPHGGHLIELGSGEYHAELLHDESTNTVTARLLDAAGRNPVAISSPEIALQLAQGGQFVKYDLKAVREPEDTPDAASRFEIVDAALCAGLLQEDARGRLQVTINGKPYAGTIEHAGHGDH